MNKLLRPTGLIVLLLVTGSLLALGVWVRRSAGPGMDSSMTAAMSAHPMDAAKMGEHHALLKLLPVEDVPTHVAVRSGAWFDAKTWRPQGVPGFGAIVHIPESIEVDYGAASDEALFIVRVDGTLRFAARDGASTKMVVDTLFSTPPSKLHLRASEAEDGDILIELRPFDIETFEKGGASGWSAAAKELYSDGGRVVDTGAGLREPKDFDVMDDGAGVLGRLAWDPKLLSLGLIAHGEVRMAGREKLSKSAIGRTAMKGDTTLLLSDDLVGWGVGDQVVITSTHYVGREPVSGASLGSQDELRTITGVSERGIELDRGLDFDHDPQREGLFAYVANLTRNILVRSSEGLPIDHFDADAIGARASRLGHVMFMHEENVEVLFAAFDALGRSNKNDTLDDFQRKNIDGLDGERAMHKVDGVPTPRLSPPVQLTNPRGRYAVHLHRTGATEDDGTATVRGSVVTGGPGWGFVSHDSRADFLDNVAYGVLGAAFVAETGNETGLWKGNIAINTYGAAYNSPLLDPRGLYRYENNDFHLTLLLEKRGSWKNHDFGHLGDGFWFQGKLIDVEDNVSVSSGLAGYFYMFRAPDQINVLAETVRDPLTIHSPAGVHPFAPALNVFRGNVSIADRCGLSMIGLGGGRTSDERSVIEDFIAWEVGQIGTHSQYYPGYTIRDSTFLASTSPDANPTEGVNFLKVMVDIVLANLTIEGFHRAYDLRKSWSPGAINQQGFEDPYFVRREALLKGQPDPLPLGYAHVLIDAGFTREQAADPVNMGTTYRDEDVLMSSSELVPGRFEIEFEDASLVVDLDNQAIDYGWLPDDPIRPTLQQGHVLLLRGTKTDSIGSIPIDYLNNVLVWHADAVQHRLKTQGYYAMPGGKRGVLLEEVFADRYTADKHIVRFVAELDPRWDLAKAIDLGVFDATEHAGVYVPDFLK